MIFPFVINISQLSGCEKAARGNKKTINNHFMATSYRKTG
jgi:hypothetical protein